MSPYSFSTMQVETSKGPAILLTINAGTPTARCFPESVLLGLTERCNNVTPIIVSGMYLDPMRLVLVVALVLQHQLNSRHHWTAVCEQDCLTEALMISSSQVAELGENITIE